MSKLKGGKMVAMPADVPKRKSGPIKAGPASTATPHEIRVAKRKKIIAKRNKLMEPKVKKKKTVFLGVTPKEKAMSLGLNSEQYRARVTINKYRKETANKFMKTAATGKKDPKVRQNIMKAAWQHANKMAVMKYGDLIKKNNLDPTFKKAHLN
jgi:hypothetical protein